MARSLTLVVTAGAAISCAAAASAAPWRPGQHRPVHPVVTSRQTPPGNPTDTPGWSDNFDSYANGTGIIGQGGWQGWTGDPLVPQGYVSNAHASSAPNSLRLTLGDNITTQNSDCVHTFSVSGGHWRFSINTYFPSTAQYSTSPYFILLNTYPTPAPAWSVQVHFDMPLGTVMGDMVGGAGGTYTTAPLVLDQWVPLVVDIDLDAGTYNATYNGTQFITGGIWNATGTAPYNLQAVDLYDDGTSEFFYDDASLQPVNTTTCYANCDNSTTVPFLNVNDFICFQSRFAAGCSAP